jgi:SEC-C motif
MRILAFCAYTSTTALNANGSGSKDWEWGRLLAYVGRALSMCTGRGLVRARCRHTPDPLSATADTVPSLGPVVRCQAQPAFSPPCEAAIQAQPESLNLPTLRRNVPCYCGSGPRYKHCHGRFNPR